MNDPKTLTVEGAHDPATGCGSGAVPGSDSFVVRFEGKGGSKAVAVGDWSTVCDWARYMLHHGLEPITLCRNPNIRLSDIHEKG